VNRSKVTGIEQRDRNVRHRQAGSDQQHLCSGIETRQATGTPGGAPRRELGVERILRSVIASPGDRGILHHPYHYGKTMNYSARLYGYLIVGDQIK
jgi:hypothetical protein